MRSRASSGTSSTVTVGRSTVRPKISGDCSPMAARIPLITGRRLITMWSPSDCTSSLSPSRTAMARSWATRTAAFQSSANRSDDTNVWT